MTKICLEITQCTVVINIKNRDKKLSLLITKNGLQLRCFQCSKGLLSRRSEARIPPGMPLNVIEKTLLASVFVLIFAKKQVDIRRSPQLDTSSTEDLTQAVYQEMEQPQREVHLPLLHHILMSTYIQIHLYIMQTKLNMFLFMLSIHSVDGTQILN